jgi:hypothetical protein
MNMCRWLMESSPSPRGELGSDVQDESDGHDKHAGGIDGSYISAADIVSPPWDSAGPVATRHDEKWFSALDL